MRPAATTSWQQSEEHSQRATCGGYGHGSASSQQSHRSPYGAAPDSGRPSAGGAATDFDRLCSDAGYVGEDEDVQRDDAAADDARVAKPRRGRSASRKRSKSAKRKTDKTGTQKEKQMQLQQQQQQQQQPTDLGVLPAELEEHACSSDNDADFEEEEKEDSKNSPQRSRARLKSRERQGLLKNAAKGRSHRSKSRGRKGKKKEPVLHSFVATTFAQPTWCSGCRGFLWGMKDQGVVCAITGAGPFCQECVALQGQQEAAAAAPAEAAAQSQQCKPSL
eukprot:TRINITY_DN5550_c0_g2_i2.p1 TRINITY_DN5550_c0_g2~~TRINITY_DN5550_c0_g2_i2.p1  ORF type:complete len:277 (+),score=78.14 TRINITY_DN5550_c0_g2_i2:58-888(+)